jgi:small acid-soluble spore protein E (minor gamma-type SASP)
MNKQPNQTASGTNIQHVKQQNAQGNPAQQQGQYGTEFGSETDVQEVKQRNAQSAQRNQQQQGQQGQQQQ